MAVIAEILIAALIVLGGAFALIGSWGLARLPSLMTRLHGPTKATTLGVGSCLVASMVYFPFRDGTWSAHELLITLFLFITAPVSANLIAKAHMHRQRTNTDVEQMDGVRDALPEPGGDTEWATFGVDRPEGR
ncbi:multicomponent K+:H+ antiporter subunit G [Sphingobium sp. B2D3A]|uniref:Na+/H+ antiporter subunit G n=1 Tax=unclassified Sphingobium TaxID=2611147 RepID=UPI00222549D0|nr:MULTISPECIES: Na+/H+ antiporter subunit G [unclassified Sphingobium]MCW2337660.1 multicomponent K+:H+ antiporter subunit G [Sphingobium sp. B2D3A]MCW2384118.1 multicomponent K+:H+ antiporter subunit G [Sphingobium sp. B2D3D]